MSFTRTRAGSLPRTTARLALSALLLAGIGCSRNTSPTAAEALPGAIAVRSDTPYVAGSIVRREITPGGFVRIRVQVPEADTAAARTDAAVVTVHPDSLLVWRDGRAARPQDLTVGRTATVWVHGPELRSLPPQVTGSAILVHR